MTATTLDRLFTPRANQPDSIPGDLMAEYYSQQVEGWKRVVAGVHAKSGHMFAPLWHTGRSSHIGITGGATPVSASVDPAYWQDASHQVSIPGGWVQPSPHPALAVAEIPLIMWDYRRAAERAMDAGFEGVELHAANGYLVDQFLQDGSNKRTDEYGGSVENRSRFLLEVVKTMVSVWGKDRVGVRVSPGGTWNGISDSNPQTLFVYVAEQLNLIGIAYMHIIEPRVKGSVLVQENQGAIAAEQIRANLREKIIAVGGFEPDSAEAILKRETADAVAFGRYFVSNPDLPRRIKDGLPLTKYDRATFYTFDAHGYTDYPIYKERQ